MSLQVITPEGIESAEAFGVVVLILEGVAITPDGIPTEEAFGTAEVNRGAVIIDPTGIVSTEAIGTPILTGGTLMVRLSGIASAEALGTAEVRLSLQIISPEGIESAEVFGTANVLGGSLAIYPSGIASEESFGTAEVTGETTDANPTLTKADTCSTPPIFSVSLNYGNFNSMVIERETDKITQYRFTNPETDLTLRTKWRYLTPKLEHNVACGFEVRGILIRYKVRGQKPKVRPEDGGGE